MATNVFDLYAKLGLDTTEYEQKLTGAEQTASKKSGAMSKAISSGAVAVGNILSNVAMKVSSVITQSVSGAVSRVDTLNQFTKTLKTLGYTEEQVSSSSEKLVEGIQGLPTTLPAISGLTQQLVPLSGNLETATDLALALNDAVVAGGSSAEAQASALQQFYQILANGKPDLQSWRIINQAMPAQLDQVAKSLMGESANANQLYEALSKGKVKMEDFQKAILKLDKEGGEGFASFAEQAQKGSAGIQTSLQNVKTAVVTQLGNIVDVLNGGKEGTNIAEALNGLKGRIAEVGKGITGVLKEYHFYIDGVVGRLGKFIKGEVTAGDVTVNLATYLQDMADSLSKEVLPKVGEFATRFAILVAETIPSLLPAMVRGVSGLVSGAIEALVSEAPQFINTAINIVEGLVNAIGNSVPQLLTAVKNAVTEIFKSIPENDYIVYESLGQIIYAIRNVIRDNLPQIIEIIVDIIDNIAKSLPEFVETIIPMIPYIIEEIADVVVECLPIIIQAILQLITAIVNELDEIIPILIEAMPKIVSELVEAFNSIFMESLPAILEALWEAIKVLVTGVVDVIAEFLEPVVTAIGEWFAGIGESIRGWFEEHIFAPIREKLQPIIDVLSPFFIAVAGLFQSVGNLISVTMQYIAQVINDKVTEAVNYVKEKLEPVFSWMSDKMDALKQAISEKWQAIKQAFWDAVAPVTNAMKSVSNAISGVIDSIKAKFTSLTDKAKTWGSDLIKNFIAGITGKIKDLTSAIDGIAGKIAEKLHHSTPDKGELKDDDEWMPDMMENFAKGIADYTPKVIGKIEALTNGIATSFEDINRGAIDFSSMRLNTVPTAGAYGGQIINFEQNVYAQAQTSADLAEETRYAYKKEVYGI